MELNVLEQLAVATAINKATKELIATNNPDNLRGQADAILMKAYEQPELSTDRAAITINGIEVGRLSVTGGKGKQETVVYVNDRDKMIEANEDLAKDFLKEHAQEFAEWLYEQGLAEIDGVKVEQVITQAQVGTRLTGCKPDDVVVALGNSFGAAAYNVLVGETE